MSDLRNVLNDDPRVAYALLFGSSARGTTHSESDIDVAVGLHEGTRLKPGDRRSDFPSGARRRTADPN